jgi:hypothetical protein
MARDILFADAPGEWFTRWAINRDDEQAAGARWLSTHATAFLLIADCDALSGSSPGGARSALQLLTQRLAAERRGRSVALVWAKSDKKVPVELREALSEYTHRIIPDIEEFSVTVYPSEEADVALQSAFLKLLEWVTSVAEPRFTVPPPRISSSDPFLIYGRI